MKINPLVTIIIPTYNRANLIGATLDSVLAQAYSNWECIVVDDNSTDDTVCLIDNYVKADERFKYLINNRKKGAQGARNSGLLRAKGEWIVFFDSDNYMYTEFLEKLLQTVIINSKDICTCFSNVICRTTNKKRSTFEWICNGNIQFDLISGRSYVDYNGALIRKQKILDIGLLDECCPSFQEWDTHIRLSAVAQYCTLQEYLVDYYIGGDDTISSNSRLTINGFLYILKKHQKIWKSKQKPSYMDYGKVVYRLLQEFNEKDFVRNKKKELFFLMPELRFRLFYKKIKLFINKIK